jgi:hypothetical protein
MSTESLQMPLRTLRSTCLKFSFDSIHATHCPIHIFPLVCDAIRVYGKVYDAEVHAESTDRIVLACFGSIDYSCQVESSVAKDEVGLATYSIHAWFLVFTDVDRHEYASLQC